jgi:hypothetical protein
MPPIAFERQECGVRRRDRQWQLYVDSGRPVCANSGAVHPIIRRRRGASVKGPKTVNHPHQVGLGELLSMASTRLRGEVGGHKRLLVALFASRAMMLY